MKKSWAITFAVVVAVWISFLVYRNMKNKETQETYTQETYSSMTKSAMGSPKAGLTFMAMAIKQYQKDTGKYPETLDVLYPNYIKDKSFVEDVPWDYSPGEDDFRLEKTVFINERPYTAYITKQLRPTDVGEEKKVMVASADNRQGGAVAQGGKTAAKTGQASFSTTPYTPAPERKISKEELERSRKKLLAALAKMKEKPKEQKVEEEIDLGYLPVGEADDVNYEIASKYFTWKTKDGAIGFGNVTYPGMESNLIYRNGKWVKIKKEDKESPKAETQVASTAEKEKDKDIAGKYGKDFLAWRDKSGAIGFGNVTYPKQDEVLVYQNGKWVKAESMVEMEGASTLRQEARKSAPEELVKKYGTTYLAWKYKTGALGFSDTTYPDEETLSIYAGGKWIATGPENPVEVLQNTMAYVAGTGLPADKIARRHGKEFFVWKNPDGTLGFSDFTLPDRPGTAVLDKEGRWIEEDQPAGPGGAR